MNRGKNSRYQQIGVDRVIRLQWLEQTANLVLAGNDRDTVKKFLQEYLQDKFPSSDKAVRGSMDKTITILMKIWLNAPKDLRSLQRNGLKLLQALPRKERIAVHWGMAMAVYPFWGTVAASAGRLLKIQGSAVASQVQRRVREQYGERETVSRRVRYLLRTFVDWGVLEETSKQGVYSQGNSLAIENPDLIAWLTEAFLHANPNGSRSLTAVLDSTSFFPFRMAHLSAERLIAASGRLDLMRHGLDQDLIMLRELT